MSYVIYAPRGPFGHFTPRSSVLTHTGTPVIDAHSPPCAYVANNDLFPYDPNVSIRLPIKVFSLRYNQPIESIHLDQSHAAPNGYTIAHSPNTKNNTRSKTPIVELF
jgi:hypothetical protein